MVFSEHNMSKIHLKIYQNGKAGQHGFYERNFKM